MALSLLLSASSMANPGIITTAAHQREVTPEGQFEMIALWQPLVALVSHL